MSQAFEYGGIDRKPVQWAKEARDTSSTSEEKPNEDADYFRPEVCDLQSEIENMLITQ